MLPEWLSNIIGLVFFIALGASIIIIILILLGRINPVYGQDTKSETIREKPSPPQHRKQTTSGLLPDPLGEFRDDLSFSLTNPGYALIPTTVDTDYGPQSAPIPRFRWWVLFKEKKSTLKGLQLEFIDKCSEHIANARIYACSENGADFLWPLKEKLDAMGASVYLHDQFHPPPPPPDDRRIVLFDTSINTGESLEATLLRLSLTEPTPGLIIFVIFNDFFPPAIRGEQWIDIGAEMIYLYKASDIVRDYWKDQPEIAQAVLTIQEALYDQLDWRHPRVNDARHTLAEVLQS